jgi:cytochrome c551/c552
MKKSLVFSAVAVVGLMSMATAAHAFSTTSCQVCHAVGYPKVGPSFKSVVAKYGNEQALAKAFEDGFAVKDRKIASSDARWKSKAGLMTSQFRTTIKGHEKAAAHAVFETVKNNNFGEY